MSLTRTAYVQPRDSIILLARRHLGSSDRWRELAIANSLTYPYITDDPEPHRAAGLNVLTAGDPILIPSAGEPRPLTQEAAERTAYGIDVAWDEFALDVQHEGERIGLDRGLRNLQKALYRRIITKRNDLPAHPEYGCAVWQHLGHTASAWRARLAALDVQRAIERDPRVLNATVTVQYTADGELRATANVTPIPPSEAFTLTATIGGPRATPDV